MPTTAPRWFTNYEGARYYWRVRPIRDENPLEPDMYQPEIGYKPVGQRLVTWRPHGSIKQHRGDAMDHAKDYASYMAKKK